MDQKYIPQSLERLALFDYATSCLDVVLEDIQSGTLTCGQETIYSTGKNGVRISSTDRNKTSTLEVVNGALVDGALAVQVGSDIEEGEMVIPSFPEILTVAAGESSSLKAVVTHKPVGTTGKEISYVYKRNSDGTVGKAYPIGATANEENFSFDPSTKTITLPTTGFAAGDQILVYYDVKASKGRKISNYDNKYSKSCRAVLDVLFKGVCDEKTYFGKIIFPKAKADGNFDLSFGGDNFAQSLKLEAMGGTCGTLGGVMWDYIIYDDSDLVETP